MKLHPQLVRTVQLIEDLRRARKPKTMTLRFGRLGLEGAVVNGEILDAIEIEEIRRSVRKIVDNGNAAKVV